LGEQIMRDLKWLWIGFALTAFVGIAPGLQAQGAPSTGQQKPPQPAAKQAGASVQKPPTAPVPTKRLRTPKTVRKAAPEAATKQEPSGNKAVAAKPAETAVEAGGTEGVGQSEPEAKIPRRDPFESLLGHQKEVVKNLPPGKAGLMVGALRLDGIVRAPNGMIAIVSNPQQRTYFLREGDQLYDGRVDKISMENVSFHEMGKDAFGKPIEREVEKRIYPPAGEQQ
jgi:type IV pilus assembly protein PilP